MAQQETLPGAGDDTPVNALDHGLWGRFVDADGLIIDAAWMRACAAGEFVGTCRQCGDYLLPVRPADVNANRRDYEAHCRRGAQIHVVDGVRVTEGCGWTCDAPGGRVFGRSSRQLERRKGER